MIPLPDATEGLAVEIIAAPIGGMGGDGGGGRRCGYMGFQPCAGSTSEIAGQTYHRPSVGPGDRHQINGAAYGVEVLHKECPPLAVRSGDDTALMGIGTGRSVAVDGWNDEF